MRGFICLVCTFLFSQLLSTSSFAGTTDWQTLRQQAKGQTVYFNAWGGDPAVNSYLDWVAGEMKQHYGVTVNVVRLADATDAVKRIQSEYSAGRKDNGSVDLLWVNGENFHTLKQAGLLKEGWAWELPNWRYVDQKKPVREDFSQPTEGAEAPWGSAQLMFIGNAQSGMAFPRSTSELLAFANAHPGKLSYPRPPDFTGTAFIEQLLIMLTRNPEALRHPPTATNFQQVTAPLWSYLDKLHPLLWREGKTFPTTPARMDRMLAEGELLISMTFNPAHVDNLIDRKQLPATAQAFGFEQGMLGNVHFVTIPANARAQAGAQVLANFLMSPQAQIRKANPAIWGDSTILDSAMLPPSLGEQLNAQKPTHLQTVLYLAEPHAAWVNALEKEWLQRYGAR